MKRPKSVEKVTFKVFFNVYYILLIKIFSKVRMHSVVILCVTKHIFFNLFSSSLQLALCLPSIITVNQIGWKFILELPWVILNELSLIQGIQRSECSGNWWWMIQPLLPSRMFHFWISGWFWYSKPSHSCRVGCHNSIQGPLLPCTIQLCCEAIMASKVREPVVRGVFVQK